MSPKIFVSKNGFASCPSCLSHIRLDADRDETVCPFCEEKLTVAARRAPSDAGAFRILRHSRSGLMAAALAGAGLSLTVACGDPEPTEGDVGTDTSWSTGEQDADSSEDVDYQYNPGEEPIMDYGDFPNDEMNIGEEPSPVDVGTDEDAGIAEDAD